MRPPKVIGHRGAAALAPENTLAGIQRAAEVGVRWVEVDVRLSADGCPVLFHDSRLERTTDGRGRVGRTSFARLRALDAGRWFSPEHAGERVPSLAEAAGLLAGLGLGADIELKAERGRGRELARAVVGELRSIWPRGRTRPLLSSFAHEALSAEREQAPDWPLGLLVRRAGPGWRRAAEALGARVLIVEQRFLTPRRVARLKGAGLFVLAYTVNRPARAVELLRWGVDSVISDRPDSILEAL